MAQNYIFDLVLWYVTSSCFVVCLLEQSVFGGGSRTGHEPLASCCKLLFPWALEFVTTHPLSYFGDAGMCAGIVSTCEPCVCVNVYTVFACACKCTLSLNSKRAAQPRCALSGFLWPRSHFMKVVQGLWCRALSCLTFSTSPWTTTPIMTSFFWQLRLHVQLFPPCTVKFSLYMSLCTLKAPNS